MPASCDFGARGPILVLTLLCSAWLASCGGAEAALPDVQADEAVYAPVARAASAQAAATVVATGASAAATVGASTTSAPTPTSTSTPTSASAATSAATTASTSAPTTPSPPAGDAPSASEIVRGAVGLVGLSSPTPAAPVSAADLGPTAHCSQGFIPPTTLAASAPAPRPANGGVFFTELERETWRSRTRSGPFIHDNDFSMGSPGDWSRIRRQAASFVDSGEPTAPGDDGARWQHGQLARDAAFSHLMAADGRTLAAVRAYLLREAAATQNDFARLRCLRDPAGAARDGYFAEATWLLRFIATYDFVRADLADGDRVAIENYVRRNAWFLALHTDHFLAYLFPARLQGDYGQRRSDAAASGDAIWMRARQDTDGNCHIDAGDDPVEHPLHAYARADGSLGPRVSVLTQWFNNRRATHALTMTVAGVLLADPALIARGKRYVLEWLTYSVFPDGSSGEFARSGDYCIARQGLVYNSMNIQAAVMGARVLARQGDRSLASFGTRDGLFGTESGSGGAPKSLQLVARTLLQLATRELDWYQAETWRRTQAPREATSMARMEVRYMGSAQAMDDFHELTLLSSAAVLSDLPVAGVLLRERAVTSLRWPGSTGLAVATGAGAWTDAWGVLPAAYLLRP